MNNFRPCDSCGEEILPIGSLPICRKCQRSREIAKYDRMELVEWDGTFPLVAYDEDRYLWSADDLWEHLIDIESGTDGEVFFAMLMGDAIVTGDGARLVTCRPDNGPFVESASLFADHQPEDAEYVDQEIENAIAQLNRAIKKHAPYSWRQANKRVDCAKVVRFLQASKKSGGA